MSLKLKTATGDVYFNPHLMTRVHLSPDHSLLTVHFVTGNPFTAPVETAEERALVAEFLRHLTEPSSGFLSNAKELLNLKAAMWVTIPNDGPLQARSADGRTHTLNDDDLHRIREIMES